MIHLLGLEHCNKLSKITKGLRYSFNKSMKWKRFNKNGFKMDRETICIAIPKEVLLINLHINLNKMVESLDCT